VSVCRKNFFYRSVLTVAALLSLWVLSRGVGFARWGGLALNATANHSSPASLPAVSRSRSTSHSNQLGGEDVHTRYKVPGVQWRSMQSRYFFFFHFVFSNFFMFHLLVDI